MIHGRKGCTVGANWLLISQLTVLQRVSSWLADRETASLSSRWDVCLIHLGSWSERSNPPVNSEKRRASPQRKCQLPAPSIPYRGRSRPASGFSAHLPGEPSRCAETEARSCGPIFRRRPRALRRRRISPPAADRSRRLSPALKMAKDQRASSFLGASLDLVGQPLGYSLRPAPPDPASTSRGLPRLRLSGARPRR